IVFLIIIGGSAGFNKIMVLAFFAPPTCSMALDVVSVNSSIFCLVPGPALLLETEDIISAYSTGTTLDTALTIVIVAWPPQITILTFSLPFAFKLSMFTDGTTNGPIAAGVKSTTFLLRLLRIEALCICALAEVASKNISAILGFSVTASIPLEYMSIPFFFASCKPSDALSIPITAVKFK